MSGSIERLYRKSSLFYVAHSLRQRGFGSSLKLWSGELIYCVRNSDQYVLSRPFFDHRSVGHEVENNPFQATYFSVAREILGILRLEYKAKSLCDIGAGNGRVAKMALQVGFTDVCAIEIDQRWRNALNSLRHVAPERFQFMIGDAIVALPRRKFDAVFMFNPMGREKLRLFLERVADANVLPSSIVLVNPQHDDLLHAIGYEEAQARQTGRHIEYRIFKR